MPSTDAIIRRIAIVVFDGFDDLDAIGPYEVLCDAAHANTEFHVRLVTAKPAKRVTSACALEVIPQGVLDASDDLIVVPGGGWGNRSERGAWAEIQAGALPRPVAAEQRRGAHLAGVCTGTMSLSAAGITAGRPATTHHAALDALRAEGANVVDARVVDDGDLITCGGGHVGD
jgi:putative intracellular protease/amidase